MNRRETDLLKCELEPIRFPGSVQPNGALLVVHPASGVIEAASETCDLTLGWRAEALLGKTLASLLGEHPQAARWTAPFAGCPTPLDFPLNGKAWLAYPQVNEAGQVLIDIEPFDRDSVLLRGLVQGWHHDLTGLRALGDAASVVREAAKSIGGITGFDRVMIYRFDDAWNGEVVAEACRDIHDQYLGHHFPASDIPKQARDLFQLSKVRQISDALYRPAALIARGHAKAVDLGPSSLRSVSPIHLEYLKNMGVRATLTGALMVEGRLWGLVACHHLGGPKYLGPAEREAFGWICEDLAALIGATVIREKIERRSNLAILRQELGDRIRQTDFRALIQQAQGADLLGVLGADGFALVTENLINTFGRAPELSRIREIQRRARERSADPYFYASNALGRDLGLSEPSDGVAGAIIIGLREQPNLSLLWFRNERSMTTRWAGDPDRAHSVAADGRISPRKSFAEFIKVVSGQCLPWTPEELESAREMRSLIEIQALWDSDRALRRSRAELRSFVEQSPTSIAMFDRHMNYLATSRLWSEMFGRSSEHPVGRSLYQAVPDASAEWKNIGQEISHESTINRKEESWVRADGSSYWFQWLAIKWSDENGVISGVVIFTEDITERKTAEIARKALENQLRESQKLAAIGTLAGGIAHNFNNILGEIFGLTSLAQMAGRGNPELQDYLDKISAAGHRAAEMVRQILAFSRPRGSAETLEPVQLSHVVAESVKLLRATCPSTVEIVQQLTPELPPVLGNASQLHQVIMNLGNNALHAMREHVGRLTIRHEAVEVDAALAQTLPGLPPGACVKLTVSDTGQGMDAETQLRVFEPFFTTKGPDEGTGLGLSVVDGIVRSHHGAIRLTSEVGRGTTFEIFLPVAAALLAPAPAEGHIQGSV